MVIDGGSSAITPVGSPKHRLKTKLHSFLKAIVATSNISFSCKTQNNKINTNNINNMEYINNINRNINLCEILKGHEGKFFYSSTHGRVKFHKIDNDSNYPIRCETDFSKVNFTSEGKMYKYSGECILFPSKYQRDWNKWVKEQKSKVPKTWSDIPITSASYFIRTLPTKAFKLTPIEKSAFALLKIHQLIDAGYGGNVKDINWKNINWGEVHGILYDREYNKFKTYYPTDQSSNIYFIKKEDAEEFLKYPENIQLLKDYFMINE